MGRPRTHSPDLERASRSLVLTAERRWRNCAEKPSRAQAPTRRAGRRTVWGPHPGGLTHRAGSLSWTPPPVRTAQRLLFQVPAPQPRGSQRLCMASTTIPMAREPGRGPLHRAAGRSPRCEGPETPTRGQSCGRSPSLFQHHRVRLGLPARRPPPTPPTPSTPSTPSHPPSGARPRPRGPRLWAVGHPPAPEPRPHSSFSDAPDTAPRRTAGPVRPSTPSLRVRTCKGRGGPRGEKSSRSPSRPEPAGDAMPGPAGARGPGLKL